MYRYLTIIALASTLMIWGCDEDTKPTQQTEADTEKVTETPVTDPNEEYLKLGADASAQMQKVLGGNLKAALDSAGVPHALTFCNVNATKLADSLSTQLGLEISRVTHKPRNPNDMANTYELELIAQYQQQVANKEIPEPQIHEEDGQKVFYAPIMIAGPLCLKCHGVPDQDIAASDFIILNMLYPEDKATGFALGDLRGMWKVKFPKEGMAL